MENLSNYINSLSSQRYILIFVVLLLSAFSYIIIRYIFLKIIFRFFEKTSTKIDDILIQRRLLNRIAYAVPLIIIYNLSDILVGDNKIISRILLSLIAAVLISCINSLLSSINDIYNQSKYSTNVNIKSYFQVIKLIINLFGLIIIISIISGQSPFYLLSGIGALTAVLMLVFKDTILSFVSSIQINSNDLFKVGDWIEAPQFGADGDVIDIALHTVKIQNWDKTISIIPTHKLIDSSFKNWRGMSDSGGRRIKRSIYIDLNSIKLCNDAMVNKYKKITILSDYISNKVNDVNKYNKSIKGIEELPLNKRALTNIGTYRAYIKEYLKNNVNIHKDMTFLVRQLSPTEKGLPIEVYVFSNNTNWIEYEGIQSDIFDHLLATISQFDLRVYQYPSGNDMKTMKHENFIQ